MPDQKMFYKPVDPKMVEDMRTLKPDEVARMKKAMGLLAPLTEKMGQFGDEHLALINDEEKALLKRRGGAGIAHPLFPNIEQFFSEGDGTDGQGQEGGGVSGGGASDDGVGGGMVDAPSPTAPGGSSGPAPSSGAGGGTQSPGPGQQTDPVDEAQQQDVANSLNDQLDPSTSKSMHQMMSIIGINSKGASMGAAIAGQAISAITGATAQGAAQGQAVVGVGGPNASTNPGTVSVTGGVNENTGPNSVSTNSVAPGDAGGGAPYDAYAQSITSAAAPRNMNRASGVNINSNLLTYAFSLMGMY